MRNNFKRFLGVAFVLIMALSVMTVGAFAAEETVAKIGDAEYAKLADAIAAAEAGDTITLTADVNESVTISKSITIDGDDNQYTGKITISDNKNVTIKNVDFVKGCIDEVAGSHGYLTINDCDFDGVDKSIGYAINHRGGDKLIIENATAKNYKTGMLYIPSSVAEIFVKNVEVNNVAAAFNITYSGDGTFENVKFNNVTYGIHFMIYGSRTYTVKNSDLSGATNPFWFWDKSNNACKVTVAFEGENIVPVFQNPIPAGALKLAEGATLTAPEGLDITTDVADSYVAYKNGVYSVEANTKVAAIGENQYKTLAAAVAAAAKGDTITLLSDVNENVAISKNLTIDGAGYKYTGNILTNNSKANVVIKNVNFVDCDAYAIKSSGAYSMTIENCTATNCGFGLLYANKSTSAIAVKNVEIDGASYGLRILYNNKTTLENVTMKNVKYGVESHTFGKREFNFINCTIDAVNTPFNAVDKGANVQTLNFKSVNDFGIDVTTLESKLVKVNAAAQIGTKIYGDLKTAVADAKDGDVITVCKDQTLDNETAEIADYKMYSYITVSDKKITIDLNGKTITANPEFDKTLYGVIVVNGTGDVTLTDNSTDKTGAINVTMAEGTQAYSMLSTDGATSKLTINGGNYYIDKVDYGYSMIYIAQTGTGYVNDGNFVLGNAKTIEKEDGVMGPWIFNTVGNAQNVVYVNGGRYNTDPDHRWGEAKFKKGFVTVQAADGMWDIVRGPVIIEEPTDITINYGKMAQFAPVIKGEGLTYTWYYKDAKTSWYKSSLTTATYDIKGTAARDGRQVYCVATDITGKSVKTGIATLTVVPNEELAIIDQPTVVEGALNKSVSVALDVTGDDLTYVWYYSDNGGKSYYKSSLTTATYDIVLKEERMGRKVYCEITDAFGEKETSKVITINAKQSVELKLLSAPVYEAAKIGETAKITLDVQGEGLKYTWYYSLPGKTTFYKSTITDSEYKVTLSEDRIGRQVYCVITDAFGNPITTEAVTLYAAE